MNCLYFQQYSFNNAFDIFTIFHTLQCNLVFSCASFIVFCCCCLFFVNTIHVPFSMFTPIQVPLFCQRLYIDETNNSIYYLVLQERRKISSKYYYFIQFICSDYFILCIGHEVEPIYWSSFFFSLLYPLFGHVWTLFLSLQKLYRI